MPGIPMIQDFMVVLGTTMVGRRRVHGFVAHRLVSQSKFSLPG